MKGKSGFKRIHIAVYGSFYWPKTFAFRGFVLCWKLLTCPENTCAVVKTKLLPSSRIGFARNRSGKPYHVRRASRNTSQCTTTSVKKLSAKPEIRDNFLNITTVRFAEVKPPPCIRVLPCTCSELTLQHTVLFRHTTIFALVRHFVSHGVFLVGYELRKLLPEDPACIVEDFLYARSPWTLENSVLEDDNDSIVCFFYRCQFNSYDGLYTRLLRYTKTVPTLNLILSLLPTYPSDLENTIRFYSLHGRPELLEALLAKFKDIDCSVLEQMKFEIRYTSREDEPDFPWFGLFPTPNNWALLSDTGNVALPSKQELAEGRARCFEILAARTLVIMTGTANPE